MGGFGLIALALVVQILVSGFGSRRLAPRGYRVAWLSCLVLPTVILVYAVWMIFDVTGMSEGGARVLLPLTVGLAIFMIVGFAASAITYRMSRQFPD